MKKNKNRLIRNRNILLIIILFCGSIVAFGDMFTENIIPIIENVESQEEVEVSTEPTVTPTISPTVTPIPTISPTLTPTPTIKPTETPVPTISPTATPSPTITPTVTPTPTIKPTATPTPTVSPTATPTPTISPTATPIPTVTPTETPKATVAPTATPAPTVTPVEPSVDTSTKYVAFTFDDGPKKSNTVAIMDAVESYGGHVTFFVLGERISGNESLIKEMYDRGHCIGNHSWNHPNLKNLSYDDVYSQINRTQQALYNIIGEYPTYMRPPYGSYNNTVKSVCETLNLKLELWSVDTLDWKSRDAVSICNEIIKNTKDGSVVLLHDLYSTSVEGFVMALEILDAQGYEFVTLDELYSA